MRLVSGWAKINVPDFSSGSFIFAKGCRAFFFGLCCKTSKLAVTLNRSYAITYNLFIPLTSSGISLYFWVDMSDNYQGLQMYVLLFYSTISSKGLFIFCKPPLAQACFACAYYYVASRHNTLFFQSQIYY